MRPRISILAPLCVALLGLTACSGIADPVQLETIAGAWAGSTESPDVHLDISVREVTSGMGSTLEGEGQLSGAGPTITVTIRGERGGDEVRLLFSSTDYMPILFTGRIMMEGTRLEGTLLGSGIENLPFALDRR
jgi:hypothetical protein